MPWKQALHSTVPPSLLQGVLHDLGPLLHCGPSTQSAYVAPNSAEKKLRAPRLFHRGARAPNQLFLLVNYSSVRPMLVLLVSLSVLFLFARAAFFPRIPLVLVASD